MLISSPECFFDEEGLSHKCFIWLTKIISEGHKLITEDLQKTCSTYRNRQEKNFRLLYHIMAVAMNKDKYRVHISIFHLKRSHLSGFIQGERRGVFPFHLEGYTSYTHIAHTPSDFLINAQVEVLCVTRPSRDLSIVGVATPDYLYRSLVVGGVSLTSAPSWSTHWRCVNGIGGRELAVIQISFTRA